MALKLFFMGTGPFAVPSLEALVKAGHQVALVISQPDRPKGRGHQLQPTAVKQKAQELGLEIFQPEKVRQADAQERLIGLNADAGCVVAFGQILPESILKAPRLGCVNVHASLLPKFRGAAPIPWAIVKGESETGVSTQQMVAQLDAGPVLLQRKVPILPQDDTASLFESLSVLGAGLLTETLSQLEEGSLKGQPQDEALVSFAPLLKKSDGAVNFELSARELERRCRAFRQWPGFSCQLGEGGPVFRLQQVEPGPASPSGPNGILKENGAKGWLVSCGNGESLWIVKLQPAGGKVMQASEYARGHAIKPGSQFFPAF